MKRSNFAFCHPRVGGARNAACIVDKDTADQSEDLDDAIERIVFGAFYQSGQSCHPQNGRAM